MIIQLTEEELRALIREELGARPETRPEGFISAEEVGKRLDRSAKSVKRYARKHGLPHTFVGKEYKFRWSDVESWLAERGVGVGHA